MSETPKEGRGLDALVDEKVMGRDVTWRTIRAVKGDRREPTTVTPRYSSNIELAWMVVEKLAAAGHNVVVKASDTGTRCEIGWLTKDDDWAGGGYYSSGREYVAEAETASLAICRAAIAAFAAAPPEEVDG